MKVNFKYSIMAFAALTLGLTSCSNDDEVVGGEDIPKGEKTAMQFVIRTPKAPATYAPVDGSATQEEIAMHSVDVLIYQETAAGRYFLEKIANLSSSDFSLSSSTTVDEYVLNSGSEIETTTGKKKIFVAMNVNTSVVTYPGVGSEDYYLEILAAELANTNDLSNTGSGFAMSSAKGTVANLVALPSSGGTFPPSNNVTATVKRLVAKVSVEEDSSLRTPDGDLESEDGWLHGLQFALGNINKTSYLIQNVKNDVVQDFNWYTTPANSFFPISDYTVGSSAYQAVDAAGSTIAGPVKKIKPVYCPENTAVSYEPDGSNLTYVSVRAQYVPEFFCQADGTPDHPNTSTTSPVSFWTVAAPGGKFLYFKDEDDANQYVNATPGSVRSAEYVDGLCYFRGYLNQDGAADASIAGSRAAKFDVLRNVYYKSVITSIKAPGAPTDTGGPKEATSLTMKVVVMPWQTHTDNWDL